MILLEFGCKYTAFCFFTQIFRTFLADSIGFVSYAYEKCGCFFATIVTFRFYRIGNAYFFFYMNYHEFAMNDS